MPQVLAAFLVQIGVSAFAAAVITTAVFIAAGLLFSGGGGAKADQSERTIRDPKPPRVWILGTRRSFGAQMLFANGPNGETADVWAYAEGPNRSVVRTYLNDDIATVSGGYVQALADGSYGGNNVRAGWNLGAETETAHAPVVSLIADWTSGHRGDGICSGYLIKTPIEAEDFLNVYPQGDNVTMSLVIAGGYLPDPRDAGFDPDDRATWTGTDNAALAHLWYRLVIKGDVYAEKFAPVEDMWIAAADDCDELYTLSAGGSEKKYRAWVMFDSTGEPSAVEDEIRACYDGWTAPDENGALKVYSGKLYEPTVSIGPDQIIDYTLQEGVEEENRVNQVIVRNISADHDYLEVECEPWRDETDILARGKELSAGVSLQVPSHTQARRLAKRKMARINAPQRGSVRVVHSGRTALTERYINLMIEEAGVTFFDGVVEVVGGERDYDTGGATIEWLAIDPNVDSWNAATEDGEPAPSASKTYLAPLDAPSITSATVELDSDSTPRIVITFTPPASAGTTWFSRWRLAGASSWNVEQHSNASGTITTGPVPSDADLEVGIAYLGTAGRTSAWSATVDVGTTTAVLASWDASSFANLREERAGTGTVTGGDPVGQVRDLSGNGLHLIAPSDGVRPVATDGLTFSSDRINADLGAGGPSDATVVFVYKGTDTKATALSDGDGGAGATYFACRWQSGATSTSLGIGSIEIDGSPFGGSTQGDLYTALADGAAHVVVVSGLDLSGWGGLTFGNYVGGTGWDADGILLPVAFLDGDLVNYTSLLAEAEADAEQQIVNLGL